MKPSTIKKRGSYKLYNAIAKYGKENFYIELLEETTPDKLDEREIFYIEKFDSYKNGYNSTNGGDSKTICKIQDIDKLKEMFNERKTFEEIAKYFGVSKVTVQRTLHSIGLKRNNKISKEFYYLGYMQASGKVREFVMPNTDKTAVEIEWLLDVPVREDLYEYIVNA